MFDVYKESNWRKGMITIRNINLKNKKQTILKFDEYTFDNKKKYVILGENGSGKTFLLRYLHQNKNKNISVGISSNKFKRTTVLIEHETRLMSGLSVWKNVIMGIPKLTKEKQYFVTKLCKQFELSSYFKDSIKNISFSKQKLIELIRAITIAPHLLLIDDFDKYFDEITSIQATALLQLAVAQDIIIICTASESQMGFDETLVIQQKKLYSQ